MRPATGGMVAWPESGGLGLVPSATCWWGALRLASVSPSAAIADDFADVTGGFGAYHGARPGAPRRRATRTPEQTRAPIIAPARQADSEHLRPRGRLLQIRDCSVGVTSSTLLAVVAMSRARLHHIEKNRPSASLELLGKYAMYEQSPFHAWEISWPSRTSSWSRQRV